MKTAMQNIVSHAFGDHRDCAESWCGFKKDPINYNHRNLPYGKDLHKEKLKSALISLFGEYSTDTVIKKLVPAANSQRNESLNSVVGFKNPKIRYYGGSDSNDFRVSCGVAQTNLGYNQRREKWYPRLPYVTHHASRHENGVFNRRNASSSLPIILDFHHRER